MAKNIILTNGTTAEAVEVNEMGMQRIAYDNTPTNTTGTTYATFATITIPAGEVIHHILLQVTMIASSVYDDSSGSGHTSQLDILIGESGSEISKYQKTIGERGVIDSGGKFHTTITYYYEPTTVEKTNGFNVLIKGKTTNVGVGTGNYCGYDKCDVFAG